MLDIASGKLTKLGGDAKPATLMFAKFSPEEHLEQVMRIAGVKYAVMTKYVQQLTCHFESDTNVP